MHLQMTYFAGKIPSMELLDAPDVTVIRSHIPDDMFNYVLTTRFTPENIAVRIDQVIELFKDQRLPFSWWIGPSDTPTHLAEALLAHGLTFKEKDVGMSLDLGTFTPQARSPLHFERVGGPKAMQDFRFIIQAVRGHPDVYECVYKHIPMALLHEGAPLEMHIAYLDSKPTVTGMLVLDGSIAGIYYVATLPHQRGKGYGTAMMEHLLKRAKKKGYILAGLEASHEGLSLYKRLGFKEVCTFNEYAYSNFV